MLALFCLWWQLIFIYLSGNVTIYFIVESPTKDNLWPRFNFDTVNLHPGTVLANVPHPRACNSNFITILLFCVSVVNNRF
jgi:hypothetical protein